MPGVLEIPERGVIFFLLKEQATVSEQAGRFETIQVGRSTWPTRLKRLGLVFQIRLTFCTVLVLQVLGVAVATEVIGENVALGAFSSQFFLALKDQAVFFLVDGVLSIVLAFRVRPQHAWGAILVSGILGIIVGGLIWWEFPSSAEWAIGTLVGINLIFSGFAMWQLTGAPPASATTN